MKKILILGSGYAGMSAAVRLKHQADCEVTVVNQHNYHHLTTLLHQPAVGHRNYQDLSIAYRYLWSIGGLVLTVRKFIQWSLITAQMRRRF